LSNRSIVRVCAYVVLLSVLGLLTFALPPEEGWAGADLTESSGVFRLTDAHKQKHVGAAATGGAFVGRSVFGKFLAGRHAETHRNLPRAADYMSEVLSAEPNHEGILRRAFILTLSDGRIGEAVGLARRLIDTSDGMPVASLLLALHHLKAGEMVAVETQLENLGGSTGPNALLGPMIGAWALAGAGQGLEALDRLTAVEGLQRIGPLRDLHLGMLAEFSGLMEEAEKFYRSAASDPDNLGARTVLAYGAFLSRTNRSKEARALFDLHKSQNPDNIILEPWRARLEGGEELPAVVKSPRHGAAEAIYLVANVLSRQQPSAAHIYVRMVLDLEPEDPVYNTFLARVLESEGLYGAAVEVLEGIEPTSAYGWLARLSLSRNLNYLERIDAAVDLLQIMTEERPERTDAVVILGQLLQQEKRYVEAVKAYDLAISRMQQLGRMNWRFFYGRGMALERSKDWDRAEADLLQALKINPDHPLVLNYLGYSWVDMGVHLDEAQEMIQRAVALRPRDGYIVDSLGWVMYRRGDYEGAVRNLERAVELRPSDPTINDHFGDALWFAGRRQEARFQWFRALGFDPEPAVKSKIEAKLDGREQPVAMPAIEQVR